jgi:sugar-specific transcriptional regulator TrmB
MNMFGFTELEKRLSPALRELGLKKQEIELYLHACLLGPSTVAVLADQLGLSASNVYKLIDVLERIGLTSFSEQKGYHRKLIVFPPSRLTELLKSRGQHLDQLTENLRQDMTDLLACYVQGDAPPVFRVLQGQEQFYRATQQMFVETTKELLLVGSLDEFVETVSQDYYQKLTQERIEKQIHLRALLKKTPLSSNLTRRPAQELRSIRFLERSHSVASMQLSQQKAILWQPNAPFAILVEDEQLVLLWRELFEQLWEKSKG